MKNKKIIFLIPDGVGIRNYLYSNILPNVNQNAEIVFWSPLPKDAFEDIKNIHGIDFKYQNLVLKPEGLISRITREAATFARLIHNANLVNNPTILSNWNYKPKTYKLKLLNKLAQFIGTYISKNYNKILKAESVSRNNWSKETINEYKKLLLKEKPSSIFITHQRVASLMPICMAAQELDIKVTTVIYSWDNLPKARLAVRADKYLVWSEYMEKEMHLYYPEISRQDIVITGTPQFEFYNDTQFKISKEDFAQKYDLDLSKKWICFSGDDILTSPNDQYYLGDLAETIHKLNLHQNYHIIFRRCPADFSDRFNDVLKKYKDLITSIDPDWYNSKTGWMANYPKYSDISLLFNVVNYCDMVVNVGSTMAHDFAMFNKPCAYIKYDNGLNPHWSSDRVYNFQHFRSMFGINPIIWINEPEDFKFIFHEENTINQDRKIWLKKIVNKIDTASSEISKILLN
nr:hypothetical protein [uncultured Flavobacterium sp.]